MESVRANVEGHYYEFNDLSEAEHFVRKALQNYVNKWSDNYVSGWVKYIDIDGLEVEINYKRYFNETETAGNSDGASAE